jgi:hypothetical protein
VVREYPDVFPDDLSGMPPDRAIEFKIELQSGTAPVYKRPYPMTRDKMIELKTQLQELLDKGYIRPSCSLLSVEEGQDPTVVHQLSTTQRSNHQEQVSIAPH